MQIANYYVIAFRNIKRWWRGEISGKRCAKNLLDAAGGILGGVGGGYGGAALGALAGPVGAVVGGIIGGIAGSLAGNAIVEEITLGVFDIPKHESVENAFK